MNKSRARGGSGGSTAEYTVGSIAARGTAGLCPGPTSTSEQARALPATLRRAPLAAWS